MVFTKLLSSILGESTTKSVRSALEKPIDVKYSSLGKMLSSQFLKSIRGNFLTIFEMWVSVNPCFLKKAITESAFSGELNLTLLDAFKAFLEDNPHELMRYDSVIDS